MRVCELISRFRALCRAELDDTALVSLIDEVEGLVCTEVLLLDPSNLRRIDYPEDSERELTVSAPHDKLYLPYLTAMAHFWCGDYVSYENQSALFNSYFAEYQRYIGRTLAPARGECEQRGYYLSAYSIAVKHGFEGSEAEWNEAVSAQLRQAEAAARSAQTHARSASDSAERAEAAIESVRAAGRELLENAKTELDSTLESAENAVKRADASAQGAAQSAEQAAKSAEESAEAVKSAISEGVNKLYGHASGRVVTLEGLSPIPHDVTIDVICEESDRIGQSVKLYNGGKNFISPEAYLENSTATTLENGVFTTAFKSGALFFNANKKNSVKAGRYTFSVIPQGNPMSFGAYVYNSASGEALLTHYVTNTDEAWSCSFSTDVDFVVALGGYGGGGYGSFSYKVMLEAGEIASEYEDHIPHTETEVCIGQRVSVPASQRTTFYTSSSDVTLVVEYERDINYALQELKNAIISLGGNI